MLEEIFRRLKQAYSQLGLGDEFLRARAEMLDSLGFVTAENIGDVISKQEASLRAAQKANDARVADALKKANEKAAEEAKKAAEEAAKKKAEQEAKAAEEAAKKAAEEAKKAAEEEARKNGLNEQMKAYFDEMEKRRNDEFSKQMKAQKEAYEKSIKELTGKLDTLSQENAKAAAEKARVERQAKILNIAKELGIPQTRIDEGFVIAEDADDAAINSYLGTVKKNIDANKLPSNGHFLDSDAKPSDKELEDVAGALLGK